MKNINNIDEEINRLLEVKSKVLKVKGAVRQSNQQSEIVIIPISKCKYDELVSNDEINPDTLYLIVEPEIGQYIEEHICWSEYEANNGELSQKNI